MQGLLTGKPYHIAVIACRREIRLLLLRVQQAVDDKAAEAVDLQLRVRHIEDRAGIPLDQQDGAFLKQEGNFDKQRLSSRLVLFDQGQPDLLGKERRLCCAPVAKATAAQRFIDLLGELDTAFPRQNVVKYKDRPLFAFEEIGELLSPITKANLQQRQRQRQQRRDGKGSPHPRLRKQHRAENGQESV